MSLTVKDGALVTLAPGEKRVINFDYDDENLGVGVTIATPVAFTITATKPTTGTALTKDNESVLSASPYNSRFTQLRLIADSDETLIGQEFRVTNTATTSGESPIQIKPRYITVKIQR